MLSITAGAVDTIGFLSLGGLFTAHITGNVVVFVAHYISGESSLIGPLLSVPVFVIVLGVVTMLSAKGNHRVSRRTLLIVQLVLLTGFLVLGEVFGPFGNPDSGPAVLTGMIGVAAMATQNALVKLAMPGSPSTAVMTTNTTQLAVDLATIVRGGGKPEDVGRARHRAWMVFPSVAGFVAGCALGGFLQSHFGLKALLLPVVLAVIALPLGELWDDGSTTR
jgi:uncharacterized membrane protein YoaK (UPF0700 family)